MFIPLIWRLLAGDESGISSIEYSMILAFVGAGILVAVLGLGAAVSDHYDAARAELIHP